MRYRGRLGWIVSIMFFPRFVLSCIKSIFIWHCFISKVFDELVKYHGSPHISSANLMVCMTALTNIAKLRPNFFMSKVIVALEMLHANLPPTLAKSNTEASSQDVWSQDGLYVVRRHEKSRR